MTVKEDQTFPFKLWQILIALGFLIVLGLSLWFMMVRGDALKAFSEELATQNNNTVFYDIDGQPFHVIQGEEDRKYVALAQTSKNLQMAVVAIEDGRFFQHFGFDPIRIGGAILRYIKNPNAAQGASTITQQLVKLTLLSPERTLNRKVKELFMAIALESHYSKAQILEFYLNKVYLGHRNYGVENASLNYFHKNSKDLTLAESAFIAGLIKKPEGYSPFVNLKGARTRQILVLMRMRALNWISKAEFQDAVNERILIRQRRQQDLKMAPYFTNHVLLELKKRYSPSEIYGGGLRIYTTLNRKYQQALEKVVTERMAKPRSFEGIGAVSLDPQTGFVYALIGGSDFGQSEFNRVTQAKRQPGSSFKPILYTSALTRGIRSNDTFVDAPVQYANNADSTNDELGMTPDVYEPENYSGEYLGEITLAHALKVSNNIVSVQILQKIGINSLARTAERFGIEIPKDRGLCLALGCGEVTLLELTNAYSVFANNGMMSEPVFILKVTDSTGRIIEEFKPQPERQVISSNQAFQMNRMLQNVVNFGTGRAAKIEEASGGKTGTSDNFRDAWFIGFTSTLVTGFWIGNDDNQPMDGEVGGRTPARLWRAYMKEIPRTGYEKTFTILEDFEDFQLCDHSGKRATPYCPNVSWYPMKPDSAPTEDCDLHTPDTFIESEQKPEAHQISPAPDEDAEVPQVRFPEFNPTH